MAADNARDAKPKARKKPARLSAEKLAALYERMRREFPPEQAEKELQDPSGEPFGKAIEEMRKSL